MAGIRAGRIGLAAALLLLLGGCAEPAPSVVQPSASPSPTVTPAESVDSTVVPATPPAPTPPTGGSADVIVAVANARIAYAIEGCPVIAWLDDSIPDDLNFGTFPEYLGAEDGTLWATHLVVLRITNGTVADWSFRLTSPLSGIPGDVERILTSETAPELSIELEISDGLATFTTGFFDSQDAGMVPEPLPGTVSVTCR